jgi:hypothetical protein
MHHVQKCFTAMKPISLYKGKKYKAMFARRFIQLPQFNSHQTSTSDSAIYIYYNACAALARENTSLKSQSSGKHSCYVFMKHWVQFPHIIFNSVFTRRPTIRWGIILASNNLNKRTIHKIDKVSDSFRVWNLWENTGSTFFYIIFSYILFIDWNAFSSEHVVEI